jgi:uncharacterized protein (DUF1800 family)
MGKNKFSRKDFFKQLVGKKNEAKPEPPAGEDPLFEKYARKTLGNRHYSTLVEIPANDGSLGLRIGNVTSGVASYAGPWTEWEVMFLLRRLSFGVKKADVENLLSLGMNASVDLLLNYGSPSNPSSTPLNYYQAAYPDSNNIPLGGNWTQSMLQFANGTNDNDVDYRRTVGVQYWLYGLCLNENTSAREKMTLFWHHFIPINAEGIRNMEGNGGIMAHDYTKLLMNGGLGNFKILIKTIAKNPAMLVYLGGQYSTAAQPNENFARELLELFTMGKLPTQNYTEQDVQSAAKIFSGWTSSGFYGGTSYPMITNFNPSLHNQTNKTFSAFFGNTVIPNQAGAAGANEFDLFFDMLFDYQGITIAKYLCRRLYRFFVYYDIDNNVETNVIEPLANVMLLNNFEILPVVKKLFKSQHFYDVVNKGVMIKSPLDYTIGMLRTLKVNTTAPAGTNQLLYQNEIWDQLNYLNGYVFEQTFLSPPSVSGWKGYYQEPTFYQNWINSNTVQERSNYITGLMDGWYETPTGQFTTQFDLIAFVEQFPINIIQDPNLLINKIVQYLFSMDLDPTFKNNTKTQTLLTNQAADYYWTTAWNDYQYAPTNISYKNIVNERLKALFTALLQLAEFQLL